MGVDVGGARKGFDVALVDRRRLIEARAKQTVDDVVEWARDSHPQVIAIDSPRSTAEPGATHRPSESQLARLVCGIRWTPAADKLQNNPYYAWIVEGLRLYRALEPTGIESIECFPTASWTRWHGARNGRSRAAWSREALAGTGLDGLPARTNQDTRDAIAAALTARAHSESRTEAFGGEIVVPTIG